MGKYHSSYESLLTDRSEDRSFEHLLLLGAFVVIIVWVIESTSKLIQTFDIVGYSVTLVVVALCYWLSRFQRKARLAKIIVFVHISCYLVSLAILSFLNAANEGSIYPLASTLQWMPILYIIAFLFLSKPIAIFSSLAIYALLFLLLSLSFTPLYPVSNIELNALMFNMLLAHGLYLVCMFSVMRLRRKSTRQEIKALEMERVANQDSLLGIGNRRYLQSLMDHHAQRKQPVSVLLIDVDHFKQINDTYGHMVGDFVLQEVVNRLRESLRPVDIIGRWGGEEFLVLADCAIGEDAESLAQRIRLHVEQKEFEQVGKVTISIGVAEFNGNEDIEAVFNRSDKALYEAKGDGRNKVVML